MASSGASDDSRECFDVGGSAIDFKDEVARFESGFGGRRSGNHPLNQDASVILRHHHPEHAAGRFRGAVILLLDDHGALNHWRRVGAGLHSCQIDPFQFRAVLSHDHDGAIDLADLFRGEGLPVHHDLHVVVFDLHLDRSFNTNGRILSDGLRRCVLGFGRDTGSLGD